MVLGRAWDEWRSKTVRGSCTEAGTDLPRKLQKYPSRLVVFGSWKA